MTISEHLELSVLTAPIAGTDRRSLSQAWYSALYPQGRAAGAPAAAACSAAPLASRPISRSGASQGEREKAAPASSRKARRQALPCASPAHERRSPNVPLAQKLIRAFARPRAGVQRAAFSLGENQGRVHVVMHSAGGRVRIIAVCRARSRERVAQALEQARYALCVRGTAIDVEIREDAP